MPLLLGLFPLMLPEIVDDNYRPILIDDSATTLIDCESTTNASAFFPLQVGQFLGRTPAKLLKAKKKVAAIITSSLPSTQQGGLTEVPSPTRRSSNSQSNRNIHGDIVHTPQHTATSTNTTTWSDKTTSITTTTPIIQQQPRKGKALSKILQVEKIQQQYSNYVDMGITNRKVSKECLQVVEVSVLTIVLQRKQALRVENESTGKNQSVLIPPFRVRILSTSRTTAKSSSSSSLQECDIQPNQTFTLQRGDILQILQSSRNPNRFTYNYVVGADPVTVPLSNRTTTTTKAAATTTTTTLSSRSARLQRRNTTKTSTTTSSSRQGKRNVLQEAECKYSRITQVQEEEVSVSMVAPPSFWNPSWGGSDDDDDDDNDDMELHLDLYRGEQQTKDQRQLSLVTTSTTPPFRDMNLSIGQLFWKQLNSSTPHMGALWLHLVSHVQFKTHDIPKIQPQLPSPKLCQDLIRLLTWGPQSTEHCYGTQPQFFWDGPRLNHAMTYFQNVLHDYPHIMIPRLSNAVPHGWWKTILQEMLNDDDDDDNNNNNDNSNIECMSDQVPVMRDKNNDYRGKFQRKPLRAVVEEDEDYDDDDDEAYQENHHRFDDDNDNFVVDENDRNNRKRCRSTIKYQKKAKSKACHSTKIAASSLSSTVNSSDHEEVAMKQQQQQKKKLDAMQMQSCRLEALFLLLQASLEYERTVQGEPAKCHTSENETVGDDDDDDHSDDSTIDDEVDRIDQEGNKRSALKQSSSAAPCLPILQELRDYGARNALQVIAQAMTHVWVEHKEYLVMTEDSNYSMILARDVPHWNAMWSVATALTTTLSKLFALISIIVQLQQPLTASEASPTKPRRGRSKRSHNQPSNAAYNTRSNDPTDGVEQQQLILWDAMHETMENTPAGFGSNKKNAIYQTARDALLTEWIHALGQHMRTHILVQNLANLGNKRYQQKRK